MQPIPKKSAAKRGAQSAKARRSRRSARAESTLEILDRHLLRKVNFMVNGERRRITTAEAIILRLMQKALANDKRAWRVLRGYREFVKRHSVTRLGLEFVDNEYTRAFAKAFARSEND